MTPAQHVRVVLAEHRRHGTSFEAAWVSALRSLPKGSSPSSREQLSEWKAALRWAKEYFRTAYELQAELEPELLAA